MVKKPKQPIKHDFLLAAQEAERVGTPKRPAIQVDESPQNWSDTTPNFDTLNIAVASAITAIRQADSQLACMIATAETVRAKLKDLF